MSLHLLYQFCLQPREAFDLQYAIDASEGSIAEHRLGLDSSHVKELVDSEASGKGVASALLPVFPQFFKELVDSVDILVRGGEVVQLLVDLPGVQVGDGERTVGTHGEQVASIV